MSSRLDSMDTSVFPNLESFKKMVRLLNLARRNFLENDFKNQKVTIQKSQFNQLMLIRDIIPCNLGKIMTVTGLTSAGASLFVEKMVQSQILIRKDNPKDRRNVLISLTPEGAELLRGVDDRLDDFILDFFHTCSEKDLITVGEAMKIISEVLEKGTSSKQA